MTTKQQEREALAKIEKILATLDDPSSYILTAFQGVIEDARHNIEDDAAYSMADRYAQACAALEAEKAAHADEAAARAALREECFRLHARDIDDDDRATLRNIISGQVYEAEQKIKQHAAQIVENATEPDGEAFREAVRRHRHFSECAQKLRELFDRIKL